MQAVVTLARNRNVKVIAVGVETCEQLAQLLALDCDQVQGFYFSKPLDKRMAQALLASGGHWAKSA